MFPDRNRIHPDPPRVEGCGAQQALFYLDYIKDTILPRRGQAGQLESRGLYPLPLAYAFVQTDKQ